MKKELTITAIYAVTFLLSGCKENVQKTGTDPNATKTITLTSMEESFPDTSYFKQPKIVVLETTEESLISEITRIAMDDSMLFIYNKKSDKLFIFDINGKYINKIDSKGNGPEEYVQTTDFTIDTATKQIILLCAVPQKKMCFTYKGEFIKEENNEDYFSRIIMDGDYIYLEDISGDRNNQLYTSNTKTGKKEEKLKTINIKNDYYVIGNSLSLSKNILYVRRYDNTIYELKDGEIIKKYLVDFKDYSYPEWLMTEEKTAVIREECRTHGYIVSISNVTENDRYILFYTNQGIFIHNKRKDTLTGYKEILNSKLLTFWKSSSFSFSYYLPLENTTMIACSFEEPEIFSNLAKQIIENPEHEKVKEIRSKHPGLLEEIVHIGSQVTEENNPVLFIYEFKD